MEALTMALDIALVVIGFTFIIAIHEAGHFWAAKRAGITCPVFSIGFPLPPFLKKIGVPDRWRNIFSFHWRGTDYRFGWIPFGGFVQMKGQEDNPAAGEGNDGGEDDFRNVSYGNKVLVICGGVIMNTITGVLFFILAFALFGVTFVEPEVGRVIARDRDTGEATQTWIENKVQAGDRVIEVEGKAVDDFEDVLYAGFFSEESSINAKLKRPDGSEYDASLDLVYINPKIDVRLAPLMNPYELLVTPGEARASEGVLQRKDKVRAVIVEGRAYPVSMPDDVLGVLAGTQGGQSVALRVDRDGNEVDVEYVPRAVPFRQSSYALGFVYARPTIIKAVQLNGPAAEAGLKEGDRVVAAKRKSDHDFTTIASPEMLSEIVSSSQGKAVVLKVQRAVEGESQAGTIEVSATPELKGRGPKGYLIGVLFASNEADYKAYGVAFDINGPMLVGGVLSGSHAETAGLKSGDLITDVTSIPAGVKKFDKLTIEKQIQMHRVAAAQAVLGGDEVPTELKLIVERGTADPKESIPITISMSSDGLVSSPFLELEARPRRSDPVTFGIGGAIVEGIRQTDRKMAKIIETFKGLFTGQVSLDQLSGPVMIAKASYDLTQYGFGTLLFFLGFISINLAFVNILPIPVLDGGLLLVVTIEKIIGRPLNENAMAIVHWVAFIAVIGLMLFVVYNDIKMLRSLLG